MEISTIRVQHYYPGLVSSSYEHPEDRRLLTAMKALKGFDQLVKIISTLGLEQAEYALNLANNIRVTPRQYPQLYRLHKQAVEALDVHEPELFIENRREVNARALGSNHPAIILTTGLLEHCSNEEIQWIISHELGHIKSNHVLYINMANYISRGIISSGLLRKIPKFGETLEKLATSGINLALIRWIRYNELTADRAAHMVSTDIQVGIRVMMKLAGGYGYFEPSSAEEFLQQAEDFKHVESSLIGKLALVSKGSLTSDHPYPIIRARELVNWNSHPDYLLIRAGKDTRAPNATCSPLPVTCLACGQLNDATHTHCQSCHAVLPETAQVSGTVAHNVKERCPNCQAWHDKSDMYCVHCGQRLMYTYFAPRRNKSELNNDDRPKSSLPGGLGAAVNEVLASDEALICEIEGSSGEGFSCTQKRLIISKAGMSAGGLRARKAYSFPFGDAKTIDHIIGKKLLRLQIEMQGYIYPSDARVDEQYAQLTSSGNICHFPLERRSQVTRFLEQLEEAFQTDNPEIFLLAAGILQEDSG